MHSWLWIAALALAGGCSFDEGGIGDDDAGGQTTDAAAIDAGAGTPDARRPPDAIMPDAPPPDGDGDGIPDQDDNCPAMANALQEDEDVDGFGDVCDNCPSVFNQSQADGGEEANGQEPDGVGDSCDPRPADTGDSIVFFDGFNNLAPGVQWTPVTGTWTTSGGALHQTSASTGAALIYWNAAPPAQARADTDLVIDAIAPAIDSSDTSRTGGLVGRYTLADNSGYLCLEYADPTVVSGNASLWLLGFDDSAVVSLVFGSVTWAMAIADRVRVRLTVRSAGNRQTCSLRNYAANMAFVGSGTDASYTAGNFGIFTGGLSASFPYFIVYGLGG